MGSSLAECIAAVQQRPVEQMASYLAAGTTFCIRVHAYGHSFTPQQQHDIVQQFRFLPVQSALSFTAPDQRYWVLFDYGDERHRSTGGVEEQTRRVYFCRELASSGKFVHQYSLKTRPYIGPTSMPADLAFLFANQALASPSKLVYDPFVGTGSLLVACAHFGATVVGADLDWKILHGLTVGGRGAHHVPKGTNSNAAKSATQEEQAEQEDEEAAEVDEVKQGGLPGTRRLRIGDNFRHYKLPRPELICSDQSLPVWSRAEVFDGIVSDPPYGVRAGARRSGRKGEVRRQVAVEFQSNRIPPSQLYDVEDVVDDLLDMAARTLKLNGRLVYLLPTTTDFSNDELPRHPCLRLVCVSEQIVRTHFSRRLITMEKCVPWSVDRNIVRRNRATQPPPKYANIKDALLLAAAAAAITSPAPQDDDKRESKRAVKRHQRYVAKREHRQRVKGQGGPTAFPSDALLLFNACIYADCSPATFADPYTWMVIGQNRVLAIGRLAAPMNEFAESERRRNMEGKTVVPGLIDSHIHVYLTGKLQHNIDLSSCNTVQEFQHTVQHYHTTHPPPPPSSLTSTPLPSPPHWLFGFGWEHDRFGRYPTAADMDAVVADVPVFLWRACYHVAVANTAALRLAGITAETVDPPGGSIDRDEHGRPTGLLREKAAGMIESLIVETAERRRQYVEVGLDYCLRMGLTCVQTNDERCWSTYKQLADEGKLPLRVFLTIMHAEMGLDGQPTAGEEYGPLLSCHRIKMFADGALGAETAALTQPYVHRCAHSQHSHSHDEVQQAEDKRDNYGILIHSQESMNEKVKRAHELGYRIEMHVIGDRAAEMAVQAFKAANIPPTARPILTHCQVLSHSLLHDMKQLNVVADIQPQFATTDCRWVDDRLSPSLQQYAYIWRTLKEGGIRCAGGSDSPIELPSPFEGMHAAIFRPRRQYRDMRQHKHEWLQLMHDSEGLPAIERDERLRQWCGGSWMRAECLDVRQALELYTVDGAYCAGREDELGVLAVGYMADFVVVDCDFVRDPHALMFATAEEVWVAGVRRK